VQYGCIRIWLMEAGAVYAVIAAMRMFRQSHRYRKVFPTSPINIFGSRNGEALPTGILSQTSVKPFSIMKFE